MITVFTETNYGDKPRPSLSFATLLVSKRQMVGRVNSRVLGDVTNCVAFGVNVALLMGTEFSVHVITECVSLL